MFDWDEINFAECAREMIVSGNYLSPQIDFEAFHEKPPFFIWLQVVFMKIFGINEFAARLPNALIGVFSLFTLFLIGKKERNERFGLYWTMLYFASLLPHFYFKSGIIDPVFNYFIFTSIYFLYKGVCITKAKLDFIYAGLLCSLAVLTKGPVGLLLIGLTFLIYFVFQKFKSFPKITNLILFGVSMLLPIAIWLGLDIQANGIDKTIDFLNYQIELFSKPVAGHAQPFYYHFVVVLFGCFPMSFIALPRLLKFKIKEDLHFTKLMFLLFAVVMILFSIVTTKIIHYSSMAYMPLAYFAALKAEEIVKTKILNKPLFYSLLVFAIVLGALLISLPILGMNKEILLDLFKNDKFTFASLQSDVTWGGHEIIVGVSFITLFLFSLYYLFKLKVESSIFWMCISMALLLNMANIFIVPNIEKFTQGAAIEFYKKNNTKDAYIDTYGFKSYAHLFYSKTKQHENPSYKNLDWLLTSDVDKPTYIVTKINRTELDNNPNFQLIKNDGVFKFYERKFSK